MISLIGKTFQKCNEFRALAGMLKKVSVRPWLQESRSSRQVLSKEESEIRGQRNHPESEIVRVIKGLTAQCLAGRVCTLCLFSMAAVPKPASPN